MQKHIIRRNTAASSLLLLFIHQSRAACFVPNYYTTRSTQIEETHAQFDLAKLSLLLSSSLSSSSSTLFQKISKRTLTVTQMTPIHMDSPSAQRNKEPIWSILAKVISNNSNSNNNNNNNTNNNENEVQTTFKVLEIAAGVGVHTLHFITEMQKLDTMKNTKITWIPTDPDETSRMAIQERIKSSSDEIQQCIHSPFSLLLGNEGILNKEEYGAGDVDVDVEEENQIDLITCINMIHISPWEATIGLFTVASQKLKDDGILYCYGPYKVGGQAVESNLNFDVSLKSRNSSWGIRDLESVVALAEESGMKLEETIEMPANNLSLIFRRVQK